MAVTFTVKMEFLTLLAISIIGMNFVNVCETNMCTSLELFSNVTFENNVSGSTFLTLTGHGLVGCARQCLTRSKCKYFNYKMKNAKCELKTRSRTHRNASNGLDSGVNNLFSDIEKWPRRLAGGCWNFTCPGNSVCLEMDAGHLVCKTECPDAQLRYGHIKFPISRDVGKTLKYICSEGYIKKGKAICKSNGSWSRFHCEQGCINPPVINNANLQEPRLEYTVGSILNYTCSSPYVSLGRVECTSNFTWTRMQCIPLVRNCIELKTCINGYYDGEYWLVPEAFVDKPVKIYCHKMVTGSPQHFLTLPEENYVDYSDTECLPKEFHECKSTRFEKVIISDVSQMKIFHKGITDRTFINQTSYCRLIQFGSSFNGHYPCGRTKTTDFLVDTRHTGVMVHPSQEWRSLSDGDTIKYKLNVTRNLSGGVIKGKCNRLKTWCYPKEDIYTLIYDPTFIPEVSGAIVPECKRKH